MATSKFGSRSARLIASARLQPELALRVQLRLPFTSRQQFTAAVARPRASAVTPVRPDAGPGVSKCRVAETPMSAQLHWFARSVNRAR
ncbi:MAG TPA: hypothetical protein VI197_15610 [Polyangiaceae bacterium]